MKSLIQLLFAFTLLNSGAFAQYKVESRARKTSFELRQRLLEIIQPYDATVGIFSSGFGHLRYIDHQQFPSFPDVECL